MEVKEDPLRITGYPLSIHQGPLSLVPKYIDKLVVRSKYELYRHLTVVDLETQVHQLMSRNQDRLTPH